MDQDEGGNDQHEVLNARTFSRVIGKSCIETNQTSLNQMTCVADYALNWLSIVFLSMSVS